MSESPEREVEIGVANGEDTHEEDGREDVDDKDMDGAHIDDDDEEKVEKDVERSPSPRARSTSPAREATPDSRSRSPVLFFLQYSLLALSDCCGLTLPFFILIVGCTVITRIHQCGWPAPTSHASHRFVSAGPTCQKRLTRQSKK